MEKENIKNKERKVYLPTNDYVFKQIFGKQENEDITKDFLNAVTGIWYEKVNLKETLVLERDLIDKKMGALDVKVIADEVNNLDIEIQVVKSAYMVERILWYWAKMYASSLDKGDKYIDTKKTICILIADFSLDILNDVIEYHTVWKIIEQKYRKVILTDKFELDIIELDKFERSTCKDNQKLSNWCTFIKNPEKVGKSIMDNNEAINKAKEEYDRINADERERRLAELREKAVMDEMAIRDSGYIEGKEEGIKDGIIEGRKEGRKEGMKEEKYNIAKKMVKENMDVALISKITGLSEKEIIDIK